MESLYKHSIKKQAALKRTRRKTYPYIAEHEQPIQFAEPFIQAQDDQVFKHQLKSFQKNLARFKQKIGM